MRLTLNVYLLRKKIFPSQALDLTDFHAVAQIPIGYGASGTLLVRSSHAQPEWLKILSSLVGGINNVYSSAAVQGLLSLRHKQRWFVITFGHAWQRIDLRFVEPDFGVRCVLNLAEPNSLRSIRRDRVADASIQAIEQRAENDEISGFGMDIERDMLRGVKAQVDEAYGFGAHVVGADAFKGTVDLSGDTILRFCRRALGFYGRSSVSKKFAWFDKIKAVKDLSVISKLENRLARAVSLGVRSITLTIPDLLAWDQYDTFSFARTKRGQLPVAEDLTIKQWRGAHTSGRLSIKDLDDGYVFAYKSGQLHLVEKWPLRRCINATVKCEGGTFVTQRGDWYRVEPDFVKQTDIAVSSISLDKIRFPKLESLTETEGNYNIRVSKSFASRYFYLDRRLVKVVGKSSIEVCDLLRFDGAMVCIKPWGGKSESLSHLFQQAVVSAQLISSHPPFLEGVDKVITSPGYKRIWVAEGKKTSGGVYVLGVIRGVPKEQLPFFAKVALVNCALALTQMRFDVRYAVIK
jgi:uncharacterized protein (TIGR04141 family)